MNSLIGIQGSPGAYHEQAAQQIYGKDARIEYIPTFAELFAALRAEQIGACVVAITNASIGFIDAPHKELIQHGADFSIVNETYVAVRHQLLGTTGTSIENIRQVHSMAPALRQCSENLRLLLPKALQIEESDTARSAELVAEWQNPERAAIASQQAGELSGLVVLKSDLQDSPINITRFLSLVLAKNQREFADPSSDKSSMLLEVPDKGGQLAKALAVIALAGINMSTLHSSFVGHQAFKAQFFLEFDASINARKTRLVLKILNNLGCNVTFLGSYKSQPIPQT